MSPLRHILSTLPNTGSVARDHLANERTFLSWTRTGLGFIALGVALAKLDALEALQPLRPTSPLKPNNQPGQGVNAKKGLQGMGDEKGQGEEVGLKIPAAALVGSGTGCLAYGTGRYFRSMYDLRRGVFRPNLLGVVLVAVTSAGVAGGGAWVVSMEAREGRR